MINLRPLIPNFTMQKIPYNNRTNNHLLTSDHFVKKDKTSFASGINNISLPKSPIKTEMVLFDADGTLFDTFQLQYESWKKLANYLVELTGDKKYSLTLQEKKETHGLSRRKMLDYILNKGDKIFTEQEKLELESKKAAFTEDVLKDISVENIIMPGAIELLKKLEESGIKFVMVTNGKGVLSILKKTGLYGYFNKKNPLFPTLIDGNDKGKLFEKSKPHPDCYKAAVQIHQADSSKCIIIEDSLEGVEAAIRAGINFIVIGSKKVECSNALPVYRSNNFIPIVDAFEKIFA